MYTVQKLVLLDDIVNNNKGWRGNIDKLIDMYTLHFFLLFLLNICRLQHYTLYVFLIERIYIFRRILSKCEYNDEPILIDFFFETLNIYHFL